MAGGKYRSPCGQDTLPNNLEDGTLCRAESPRPTSLGLCTDSGSPDTSWGYRDAIEWKVLPESLGGGWPMVRNYKDSWVTEHAPQIRTLAAVRRLPPELLAGVAWIEAGGKPYDSKFWVYVGRTYAHSAGLDLEPTKITKNPGETSLGPVAIQLRRAAEAMGLDFATLSGNQKDELVRCLLNANNNLAIVAAHLEQLVKIDFPATRMIGKEEMRIIGSRYNRGPQLSLQQIRQNTSYGDVIVDKLYPRLQKLLETSESKAP